jgi:murein L,D-transpeptidase YcbB/YkuD
MDSSDVSGFFRSAVRFSNVSDRVIAFYARRSFRCAWIDSEGPNDRSLSLSNLLLNALEEGVVLRNFDPVRWQALFDAFPADSLQGYRIDHRTLSFELELTSSYFLMADAATSGLPVSVRRSLEWYLPPKKSSPEAWADALADTTVSGIASPHPEDSLYHRLYRALQHYRELLSRKDWSPLQVPMSPLYPGDTSTLLCEIKRRLHGLGDFPDTLFTAEYDLVTDSAVRIFRSRHSLPVQGAIDSAFVSYLNVSPEARVRQLLVNMERCRWLPAWPSGNYILVNIPEYRMHVYKDDIESWSSPVIVGTATKRTTVFSGKLTRIVFNPYWNVPRSIIKEELLPVIIRDRSYLTRNHYEIRTKGRRPVTVSASAIDWKRIDADQFPYEILQQPGPWNALGSIKFLFPNSFSIYLHDTPSKGLFAKEQRMFSHGCIRVSEPVRLAAHLLDKSDWSVSKVNSEIKKGKERTVQVPRPVPVFVVYFTAWVDDAGLLHFAEDGYGHDERLAAELFGH